MNYSNAFPWFLHCSMRLILGTIWRYYFACLYHKIVLYDVFLFSFSCVLFQTYFIQITDIKSKTSITGERCLWGVTKSLTTNYVLYIQIQWSKIRSCTTSLQFISCYRQWKTKQKLKTNWIFNKYSPKKHHFQQIVSRHWMKAYIPYLICCAFRIMNYNFFPFR